ncbi:MAG: hypothetical protein AB7O96_10185 [Pseudobdellovibrionaceae bacterium]
MLSMRVICMILLSFSSVVRAEGELSNTPSLSPKAAVASESKAKLAKKTEELPDYSGADPLFAPAPQDLILKNAEVRGFKEWKSQKVQEAVARVTRTRTEIEQEKQKADKQAAAVAFHEVMSGEKAASLKTISPQTSMSKLELQLKQSQFSLEIAKELAVTDYFALYLSRFPDKKKAFADAASKLSPDEMAELMAAFEKSLTSGSAAEKPQKAVRPASASLLDTSIK